MAPIKNFNAGQIVPQKQQVDLNSKEKQKVSQQQAQRAGQNDAARLAQQAGFSRSLGASKKKRFDVGDSSQAPIPLPEEDGESENWSQEKLDSAQGALSLASAQFGEIAKAPAEGSSLGSSVVASSFMPTEDDISDLEDLAKRPAPQAMALEEVTTSVGKHFGIMLPEETSIAEKILAAGLVVAGEKDAVITKEKGLDDQSLADGIQKVSKRSNQAVGQAQMMNKGINKELNLQRTFVMKR
ncbi:MAG: hypothetical protein QGI45_17375 [Myxococcota bacterium]|jgi:hypothetical protein|nr:hypothetical protein [Myxococcota bacterium]